VTNTVLIKLCTQEKKTKMFLIYKIMWSWDLKIMVYHKHFKKMLKCDIRFSTYHWYRGEQVEDSLGCE